MGKKYIVAALSLIMGGFLGISSQSFADDNSQVKNQVGAVNSKMAQVDSDLDYGPLKKEVGSMYVKIAQVNAQLDYMSKPVAYPRAKGYYDDLVDHYEQDQLMRDTIDQGIQ